MRDMKIEDEFNWTDWAFNSDCSTFSWTCPYCLRDATITDNNFQRNEIVFEKFNAYGKYILKTIFIVCPNPQCQKFTLTAQLKKSDEENKIISSNNKVVENSCDDDKTWSLIPPSNAKPFPSYIPEQIRADYQEACLIKELSPKASATLCRRCLQGIIRDCWKIQKPKLIDEIDAIKDKVDKLTWKAIDAVRRVGNIGAHMGKDVNLIADIEEKEVDLLIGLIETLLSDWYINRIEREDSLKAIINLGKRKQYS